jgi:hypothetical protein
MRVFSTRSEAGFQRVASDTELDNPGVPEILQGHIALVALLPFGQCFSTEYLPHAANASRVLPEIRDYIKF